MTCSVEVCEKLFVKLGLYWRSALIGFIALLTFGGGVWCWTWAEIKADQALQNQQIHEVQAGLNEIAYLRSQSNETLENQKEILEYQKKIIAYFERGKR